MVAVYVLVAVISLVTVSIIIVIGIRILKKKLKYEEIKVPDLIISKATNSNTGDGYIKETHTTCDRETQAWRASSQLSGSASTDINCNVTCKVWESEDEAGYIQPIVMEHSVDNGRNSSPGTSYTSPETNTADEQGGGRGTNSIMERCTVNTSGYISSYVAADQVMGLNRRLDDPQTCSSVGSGTISTYVTAEHVDQENNRKSSSNSNTDIVSDTQCINPMAFINSMGIIGNRQSDLSNRQSDLSNDKINKLENDTCTENTFGSSAYDSDVTEIASNKSDNAEQSASKENYITEDCVFSEELSHATGVDKRVTQAQYGMLRLRYLLRHEVESNLDNSTDLHSGADDVFVDDYVEAKMDGTSDSANSDYDYMSCSVIY